MIAQFETSTPLHLAGSDWIEHDGGRCPVDPQTPVMCRTRDGDEDARFPCIGTAGDLSWSHNGGEADIIAFRIPAATSG